MARQSLISPVATEFFPQRPLRTICLSGVDLLNPGARLPFTEPAQDTPVRAGNTTRALRTTYAKTHSSAEVFTLSVARMAAMAPEAQLKLPFDNARADLPTVLRARPEAQPADTEILPLARQRVQAILDVVAGLRSVSSIHAYVSCDVLGQLRRAASRRQASPVHGPRPQIHSVHLFAPQPCAVEVTAVVKTSPQRATALALRLEIKDDRWRIVSLESKSAGTMHQRRRRTPGG